MYALLLCGLKVIRDKNSCYMHVMSNLTKVHRPEKIWSYDEETTKPITKKGNKWKN